MLSVDDVDAQSPLMPTNSPVPEPGTITTDSSVTPSSMMSLCCSTKLPSLPATVPVNRSTAT